MPPKPPPTANRRGYIPLHYSYSAHCWRGPNLDHNGKFTYYPGPQLELCTGGLATAFPYIFHGALRDFHRFPDVGGYAAMTIYAVYHARKVPSHIDKPLRAVLDHGPSSWSPDTVRFYRGRHRAALTYGVIPSHIRWRLASFLNRVGWQSCYLYAVPGTPNNTQPNDWR